MKTKSKRIKQPLAVLATKDDAIGAMNELALAVNNQRIQIARRDKILLEITQRYAADMAACETFIQDKTNALRAWAEAHPEEFPPGRKSLNLMFGTLGFRTGTPKLALLSRAWTWEKVLDALRNSCMGGGFIRTKEEVDKESLLAQHACQGLSSDQLATAGVKVVQEESFYVEPDLTNIETLESCSKI